MMNTSHTRLVSSGFDFYGFGARTIYAWPGYRASIHHQDQFKV